MPLIEQRINYCLTDQYGECERYKSFKENPHLCAMERREYRRATRHLEGYLFSVEKRSPIETVDISLAGAKLKSAVYVTPGQCVEILLRDDKGREFDARVCVRWASPKTEDGRWIMGVQFNPLPEGENKETLEQIVWQGDVT